MIHHREKSVVRRFDIFKLIVLLILIALLLWFWLSPPAFVQGPDNGAGETAVVDTTTDSSDVTTDSSSATTEEEGASELETAVDAEATTAVPTIEAPMLGAPDLVDGVLAGSTTLSGSGTPGSTVRVLLDGQPVGEAIVAEDGRWSLDVDLAAGTYDLSLEALDDAGSVANSSDPAVFAVRLEVPTLTLPEAGSLAGPVTLTGTGTPGSQVNIVVDDAVVGSATVAVDGTWAFDTELAAGNHGLHVQAVDAEGNVVNESEGLGLELAAAEGSGDTAAEETDATEDTSEFVPPTLALPEGELLGGEITLSGTGMPGSEVAVLADGEVAGTAVVGDDGTWNFPTTLPAGEYEVALQAVDGSGTAVTTEPISLALAEAADIAAVDDESETETAVAPLPADFCKDAAPGIDQGDTYVVGVCEWLVKIANRLGIPYADLIGVNPQIANPNLIYPGQVINLPPR
jgi:hypothetical protein